MSPLVLAILAVVALFAAALSATLGMAGGVLLLSVLTVFFTMKEAVPLHGFAQFFSNVGRVVSYFKDIEWSIGVPFIAAVIPGALLGVQLMARLDQLWVELVTGAAIAIFVLTRPRAHGPPKPRSRGFFALLGFSSAAIGMVAGATGPMIAPFFMGAGLEKRRLVATKAACQASTQFAKVPFFWAFAGFSFGRFWPLLIIFTVASIAGAWLGSRVIDRISEHTYERVIRWTVAILASRMAIEAGWGIVHRPEIWTV